MSAQIGKESGKELYAFLLKDSRVPDGVIDGVVPGRSALQESHEAAPCLDTLERSELGQAIVIVISRRAYKKSIG